MINTDPQNIDTGRTHRKQGGAFDTIARILKGVQELVFRSGVIIRNRPRAEVGGAFTPSSSVFEAYHKNTPGSGKYNLMYIGRDGLFEETKTSYVELNADARSEEGADVANGQVRLSVSVDGEAKRSAILIINTQAVGLATDTPGVRCFISGEGEGGGAQISYIDPDTGLPLFAMAIDSDGIQLVGLPTSDPGIAGALYTGTISIPEGATHTGVLKVSAG